MKLFVKVCGITNVDDALEVRSAGADAIGLMLYKESPRYIDIDLALEIYNQLENSLDIVLVFVNAEESFVRQCFELMPNAIAQFHGNESEVYCSSFGRDYIKAIGIKDQNDLSSIEQFSSAKMILLDSFDPKLLGGTGTSFDWKLLNKGIQYSYILAGGLNAENIELALSTANCSGVDVSSGVESGPRKKSAKKIHNFLNKVRNFNG